MNKSNHPPSIQAVINEPGLLEACWWLTKDDEPNSRFIAGAVRLGDNLVRRIGDECTFIRNYQ